MEVFYRPSPEITIKLDVKDIYALFDQLGPLQEIMKACECGKCKSKNIRFLQREAGKFTFYELQCQDCSAKLSLGNNGDSLFPRRYEQDPDDPKKPLLKDGKKVWLVDGGWMKYDFKTGEMK